MDIVAKTVKDIKSIKIQGASNVRKKAIEALLKASQKSTAKDPAYFRKEFLAHVSALFHARPTEPELRTALRIIQKSISEKSLTVPQMKERLRVCINKYELNRKEAMRKIAQYGADMIQPNATILTICHSHTVVDVLIKAKHKIKKVYCCETRPLYQGRMTVRDLTAAGIDATLIVDNAASTILKECDYLFSGADAFLADGDVINKIGTNQMSMLASHFGVKHYAVFSTHKFEPATFFGKDEPIEIRSPDEVWAAKERGKIKVLNPAFDRTDSKLIEGIICELGIFPPQILSSKLFDELELDKHELNFLKMVQK